MIRSKDSSLTQDGSGQTVLVYAQTLDPVRATETDLEFYDLRVDPYQLDSLHGSTDSRRMQQMAALRARLERLKTCAGSGCWSLEY
jgi:hypothetical protein